MSYRGVPIEIGYELVGTVGFVYTVENDPITALKGVTVILLAEEVPKPFRCDFFERVV